MPKLVSRPVGNFETADDRRLNMIRSTKPAFTRLRDDTERPEWKEKYATVKVRLAEHEYLTAECAAWFKSRACAGAKAVCDRAGAPVFKLMSVKDIFEDPRYAPWDFLTAEKNEGIHVKTPDFPVPTPPRLSQTGRPKMENSNREIGRCLPGYFGEQVTSLEVKRSSERPADGSRGALPALCRKKRWERGTSERRQNSVKRGDPPRRGESPFTR